MQSIQVVSCLYSSSGVVDPCWGRPDSKMSVDIRVKLLKKVADLGMSIYGVTFIAITSEFVDGFIIKNMAQHATHLHTVDARRGTGETGIGRHLKVCKNS